MTQAETPRPLPQVTTWEPSNAAIAARYGLRPEQILRFDLNTSPWEPPFVAEALGGPFDPPINEYPDSWYAELTEAAAAYVGVEPEAVVLGAGADEVLDLVTKAFLPAGAAALVPIPTYSMYGVFTGHRAARMVPVPRRGPEDGYVLDVDAVIARLPDVSVVWLCSPNNPTGHAEPEPALRAVLEAASAQHEPPLVVVDEAYFEFGRTSVVPWRASYPNVLAVRTLSKAFALSGLRVGYGVANRSVIERLERVRPPGSISTVSAHVAARALRAPAYAIENAAALSRERDWLAAELRTRGWESAPSVCNFVLVRIGTHEAAERAADGLLRRGIVPRPFGPANPLRGHLRLTVRTREENLEVLRAIDDLELTLPLSP